MENHKNNLNTNANMSQPTTTIPTKNENEEEEELYDLSGLLLHIGSSAYGGSQHPNVLSS
jgi:hypothetical protein